MGQTKKMQSFAKVKWRWGYDEIRTLAPGKSKIRKLKRENVLSHEW